MSITSYHGSRIDGLIVVWSQGGSDFLCPLSPRASLGLRNHSPDGFNWGYGGSGPAQLALAILFDYFGERDVALNNYQSFKRKFIATIKEDFWRIETIAIKAWVELKASQFGGVE